MMMCECRSITYNKCTVWRRMLIQGRKAQRVHRTTLYLLLNFAVNLKLFYESE